MSIYQERLWPTPWIFIATALVIPASLLVFLPINLGVGITTAVILYAVCVAGLIIASPTITVDGTRLTAGRATIPLALIGEVSTFRGEQARQERGPRLDARAWLLIRGWVDPVVRLEITDAADPVPYWLISSRQPEELAAAIARAGADRHR